jgi:hypothetical protein
MLVMVVLESNEKCISKQITSRVIRTGGISRNYHNWDESMMYGTVTIIKMD